MSENVSNFHIRLRIYAGVTLFDHLLFKDAINNTITYIIHLRLCLHSWKIVLMNFRSI